MEQQGFSSSISISSLRVIFSCRFLSDARKELKKKFKNFHWVFLSSQSRGVLGVVHRFFQEVLCAPFRHVPGTKTR